MKALIGCIVFCIIVLLVNSKSITKRDCCDPCSPPCNCNSRPCNSGYSNCNTRSCNSGYSNCNTQCNSDCNKVPCEDKSNCNQKNKPCNDDNEDTNPDEVLPVLVPVPQNIPAKPITSPDATINNTNINNATVEFTLTNSINTVNNISVPISINSTNQNSIVIHLDRTKEYDQVEQLSIEGTEDPNCCYGIGKKCEDNQVCKGVPLEAISSQPIPQSTTSKIIQPEVNSTVIYPPIVNNTVVYDPRVNNTAAYQPTVNNVRLFYQPMPLPQFPFQPLPPIPSPCSANSETPCSQSQPLPSITQPIQIQPSVLQLPPISIQPPAIQSPCSLKSGSSCSQSQAVVQPFSQISFLPPYQSLSQIPFPPPYQPLSQISLPPPYQPLSQISFQRQYQPQPQISIPQQSSQPGFIQPSIQPTANCGYQGQQTVQPLPFPVSPCGQINTQSLQNVRVPVFQTRSNVNSYYIRPNCFYQNLASNQLSNIYLHCIGPVMNQPLYQPNIPFQQLTGGYGVPQQVQKSSQTENQSALLQRLLTALQQQQQQQELHQQGQQQPLLQNQLI